MGAYLKVHNYQTTKYLQYYKWSFSSGIPDCDVRAHKLQRRLREVPDIPQADPRRTAQDEESGDQRDRQARRVVPGQHVVSSATLRRRGAE